LDRLAEAIDANMNAAAQNPAASQQPQEHVNIPLAVAKEGLQGALDLKTQSPVQGAVSSAKTFQEEFVAAVVTPNSNQATAHGVKAVGAAMKFTVFAVRATDKVREFLAKPPASPAQMTPGSDKPPDPTAPKTPATGNARPPTGGGFPPGEEPFFPNLK